MAAPVEPSSWEAIGNTSIVLVGLIAATVELLIGIAIGWWLRGSKQAEQPSTAKARESEDKLHHAEHALTNLRELTQRVQADVGAHSSRVEAISHQLSQPQDHGEAQQQTVIDAVSKILTANQQLEQRLHSAESKLQKQAEQIRVYAENALTDALTGLANRRAFDTELARRIAEYLRYGQSFCLIMLDIDHFKNFNDTHGHLAGDQVLRLVGETLKATVRTPDFVARYGGEEFAIIMPQTTVVEGSRGGERIRQGIERAGCAFEDQNLYVTASIGVAEVVSGQTSEVLIQCADEALYRAKQTGRNQVQVYKAAAGSPTKADGAPIRTASAPAATSAPTAPASDAKAPPTANTQKTAPAEAEIKLPSSEQAAKPAPAEAAAKPKLVDSRTDAQTGLPNRTEFCEETRRRLAEAARQGGQISLMLIKVDNLAALVARHGPALEDLTLRTCTQFLTAAMREMDLVARYHHDVFAVILPGTALMHAVGASERLRTAIENCPLQLAGLKVQLSVSIGVDEAKSSDDTVSFITRANEAQRAAVEAGGNRVHYHNGTSIEALSVTEPALA